MIELFRLFGTQILKYGAIVGGVFLILLKARQDGKQAEQRKYAMDMLKQGKISAKIDNDVAGASDAELNSLRRKWTR